MLTIYSDDHALQDGQAELVDGKLVPCFEMPRRAFLIRDRVREVGLGEIRAPHSFGRGPAERVHRADFVEFLATAWGVDRHRRSYDGLPWTWPTRHLRQIRPERIDALMGYSFDAGTPITAGTWQAAQSSADVAVTSARLLAEGGHPAIFALCRPPGHHAAADLYGGYCFLNNAAIAAQYLIDGGAERVAILDVDYHHGNGTQAIFYDRPDVLFLSLHGDPREEYRSSSAGPTSAATAPARGSTSTTRCPGAPAFRPGRKRWRMPASGSPTMPRTCSWSRLAWTRSRATRSPSSASRATTSPPTAPASPGSGCRPCSSWRAAMRRADRRQHRQRAAGFAAPDPCRRYRSRSTRRPRQGSPSGRTASRRSAWRRGQPAA